MNRIKKVLSKGMLTLNKSLGIVLFVIVWQIASILFDNPAVPKFVDIFNELLLILSDSKTILHITASLKIVIIGIVVAVIFGFTLSVIMTRFKVVMNAMMPLIECLRGVAALTLFPLLIVVAGLGDGGRIFVIFWTAWPSVLIATLQGLETKQILIDAAHTMGATEWQVMTKVRIPLAMPKIVNGIRIGISGGWISLIAAEMLGATKGIGYMLLWNSHAFNFKAVYAYIIIIALLGGLMNFMMQIAERKAKERFS